jgi:hypothetical protein
VDDKRTPLDDRLQRFIGELSSIASDPQMVGSIDPRLTTFMGDLFSEIDKAIRAERGSGKRVTPTASQFWISVQAAIDQIKRRALDEPNGGPR